MPELVDMIHCACGQVHLLTGPKMDPGHGDAAVSYGASEAPKYRAIRRRINLFYADLLAAGNRWQRGVFQALAFKVPRAPRSKQEEGETFELTDEASEEIGRVTELFLVELFGPNRTRDGFVVRDPTDDNPDGIVQQQDWLSYSTGVGQAAALTETEPTIATSRNSPAVNAMLNEAFDRLSQNGQLRLEGVLDEVHALLVAAQDAGLSPLQTARELTDRFGRYKGFEFERLARTEAAYASERGLREQLREMDVESVEILVSAGACPICEPYDGQVYPLDDVENLPPYHPNCLCSVAPSAESADISNLAELLGLGGEEE